jgi:peptidoglycan/xylan/chitin deacetylase (PgdA/CDA1 family)
LTTLLASGVCPGLCAGEGDAALLALFRHDGLIRKGDRGDLVRALQEALDAVGYAAAADGIFGDETMTSLAEFQRDHDLDPDGLAGPATLAALQRDYFRRNPPASHTVTAGETLSSIADLYGVDVGSLLSINRLADADLIYAGQAILIRSEGEEQGGTGTGGSGSSAEPVPGAVNGVVPVPQPVLPPPTLRICLTFDDGPDIYTTRPILAILQTYGVKATFFLVGAEAAKHPDLVKEIADAGHVIGVHGYDHKVLASLSATEVRGDLKRAQDTLQAVAGKKPWLYRPPSGTLDRTQVDEAEKLGLTTLMWTNVGGADLGVQTALEVVSRVTETAKDGGVILLHEGLQRTVEALPALIEALARLGFGFQNVSRTSAPAR